MERLKVPLSKSPPGTPLLRLRDKRLPLGNRTYLMGILNVTPDSFSDGGIYLKPEEAVRRLETLLEEDADFVDVGGESTRPGAAAVSVEEETRRILPILEAWKKEKRNSILSIDTSKSEVAETALQHGASVVNDVTALRGDSRMAGVVARYDAGVVLMHMRGTPRTMQENPTYTDVVSEIIHFFEETIREALRAGIREEGIILDPGIGFGKTASHNLEILRRLQEFRSLGKPLLVGPSRKSFIGEILNLPVGERLFGTAASVTASILKGADIVRVHDVEEMRQVARVADAIGRGFEGRGK